MGKLLGCGRRDGEAWRWAFPAGSLWGLDGSSKGTRVAMSWRIVVWTGSLAAVLLACLDDLSLSLSYVQTALELLTHGRVLGVEAR
jgi:hypothetical protein